MYQFFPTEPSTSYLLHWDADIGTDQDAEIVLYIQDVESGDFFIAARGEYVGAGRCEGMATVRLLTNFASAGAMDLVASVVLMSWFYRARASSMTSATIQRSFWL